MSDMIGDDTGDNISEKNPFYSELTAQYWAWKNYYDSEYIGFCHYRRYFAQDLTSHIIEKIFESGTDVIVVGPCMRGNSRWGFLQTFVCGEDLAIMQMVIKKICPDYYKTMSYYGNDFLDYPLNMFICRRDLFEKYAEWIFSILFECENYVQLSPYSRARRLYGYLAEFLMPVFFMHNKCKISVVPYYRTLDQMNIGTTTYTYKQKLKRFMLKNVLYFRSGKQLLEIDGSILLGLKNDGIIIN